jgi:hypothetical protein
MDLDGSLNAESASSGLYKLIWMQDGRLNRAQDALIPTISHAGCRTAFSPICGRSSSELCFWA